MEQSKKIGRKPLNIDKDLLESEIKKYINGQKAITTYTNLKIGKTSFYEILKKMGVKRC